MSGLSGPVIFFRCQHSFFTENNVLLRPRQTEFVDRAVAALRERGNTLAVASTGFGKTIALAARQTISGTVGEIATGFVGPSQTIALSARQTISGTVGEIASGEVVPSDAVISDVVLAINDAGGILTGESFATDHVIGILLAAAAVRRRRRILMGTFYDGGRGVR